MFPRLGKTRDNKLLVLGINVHWILFAACVLSVRREKISNHKPLRNDIDHFVYDCMAETIRSMISRKYSEEIVMGSFDANCCLTGLPITKDDQVRVAILVNEIFKENYYGSPAGHWIFCTPAILAQYDTYGGIELSSVSVAELKLFHFFLKLYLPGLESDDSQSKPKSEWSLEDIWNGILHAKIKFDPSKEFRTMVKQWEVQGRPEQTKPPAWYKWFRTDQYPGLGSLDYPPTMAVWMCHAWAWDALLSLEPLSKDPRITEELDAAISYKMIFDQLDKKYGQCKFGENQERDDEGFTLRQRELRFIFGHNGGMDHQILRVVRSLDRHNPDLHQEFVELLPQFRNTLATMVQVVQNMELIRKIIMPRTTCGMQYEDFKWLGKWNRLVTEQSTQMQGKYLENIV